MESNCLHLSRAAVEAVFPISDSQWNQLTEIHRQRLIESRQSMLSKPDAITLRYLNASARDRQIRNPEFVAAESEHNARRMLDQSIREDIERLAHQTFDTLIVRQDAFSKVVDDPKGRLWRELVFATARKDLAGVERDLETACRQKTNEMSVTDRKIHESRVDYLKGRQYELTAILNSN